MQSINLFPVDECLEGKEAVNEGKSSLQSIINVIRFYGNNALLIRLHKTFNMKGELRSIIGNC